MTIIASLNLFENSYKPFPFAKKVLLLVTQDFLEDEWCIFAAHHSQRNILDPLPDRLLVVFIDDPRHIPPMSWLHELLRTLPEQNVFHVPRDTPAGHPVWGRLAEAIIGE